MLMRRIGQMRACVRPGVSREFGRRVADRGLADIISDGSVRVPGGPLGLQSR